MESFAKVRSASPALARRAFAGQTLEKRAYVLPALKLDHLFRMTDDTGMFQHAIFNVPNYREGYCTDDNARAFILTLMLPELTNRVAQADLDGLASIYLSFLWDALTRKRTAFVTS